MPLTGCSKIKTPTFERHSNEVTFDEFVEAFKENKIEDYFVFNSSRKGKAYYASEFSSSAVLGDTAISEMSGTNEAEINFSFDGENNRSTLKEKGESSLTSSGAEADEQRVSKLSTSYQFQFDKAQESFIYIDTRERTYKKYEGENVTDTIVGSIDDEYLNFYSVMTQYETAPEEVKEGYGFYLDGSVFTLDFSLEEKTNTVDTEDKVVQETSSNIEALFQFEIKDGKFYFRSKTYSYISSTYMEALSGHLKDEVDVSKETNYCSLEMTIGALIIKEVDTSAYISLDKDTEAVS